MSPISLKSTFLHLLPALNAASPSSSHAKAHPLTPAPSTTKAPDSGRNAWTTVNSGSHDNDCRVMIYHTDKMNVPSQSDCMNTFNNIINACIVSKPGKSDEGGANEGSGGSPGEIAKVQSETVYQIGAVGYLDFSAQLNRAYTGAYADQEGAAAHVG